MRRLQFVGASAAAAATVAFPSFARAAEDLQVQVAGGTLYGTLERVRAPRPVPVVLIIAGSGPTDRDGNAPAGLKTDAYKLLAQALAARGIASFRYDKRGIAASRAAGSDERALLFDTFVDDAVAIALHLRRDPQLGAVTIAGHSEGSLIGMLAARKAPVSGFVSVAGAGRPAETILLEQVARPGSGLAPADVAQLKTLLDRIASGESVADVPAGFAAFARPAIQPYLRSWFRYDPAAEIAKLTTPTAIVQGLTDLQITRADAERLAQAAPAAKLRLIPHMNHVLKDTDAPTVVGQMAAYTDPSLPLDPAVADVVAEIVRAR